MTDDQDVYTDPLFIGLTRPATIAGVPIGAVVFEWIITDIVFIGVGNPLYMLMLVPFHGLMYLVSANDHGMFDDWQLWVMTYGKCLNTKFWGGAASFSPLQTKKWTQ